MHAGWRDGALAFVERIEDSVEIDVIFVDRELHARGLQLLRSRSDKDWSLREVVSIWLMGRIQITQALTTDRHFVQAGFSALLK